ncbi:hypothetical protein A3D77_02710 [Candidatus Gottesmanbacteria bacterium RIFCSPHIGHO2_02_FULL_39_11]|uniref:Type II secretion system protein GspF domain-containing protein n=1 Tax=Candidatus Gottesmanbacteria bacterium RIFCSPHIGHO2_02_FULL_39_11 TaxID=1798382 RepID=A0A1F5ZTD1_9BACT|nr:MAG: hypothetical protein A3D77_02710 [Candidatus Gottesmanbacteria bacterium RIFCSPHIGHO2_02_FULL_39_11]
MARFSYTGKDKSGTSQKGFVEATNLNLAAALLHEQGSFIINLKEVKKKGPVLTFLSGGVSANEIINFTRQLSTMITAGLTLVEGLSILSKQNTKPSLHKMIVDIRDEVQGGSSFAKSLEKYPRLFSKIYIALVKAGEASGKLDVILIRLSETLEKSRGFKSRIKGAFMYPIIVVIGMVAVSVVVMVVVVPRMTGLYKDFGVTLPLPTRILITLSDGLIRWGWLLGIILVLLIVFYGRFSKTRMGRTIITNIILSLPIIGPLIKESILVEITRTLAILIDGGVPILTALQIARDATTNIRYQDAFTEATRQVEKGFPLSDPFLDTDLFPPILSQMVAVGEQTGKLGDSLMKLSVFFESESEVAVKSLTTLIEPLIMVVLGLGVGFLVIAVLLPIYSLTSKF